MEHHCSAIQLLTERLPLSDWLHSVCVSPVLSETCAEARELPNSFQSKETTSLDFYLCSIMLSESEAKEFSPFSPAPYFSCYLC